MKEREQSREIRLPVTENTEFLVFCLTCYLCLYVSDSLDTTSQIVGDAVAFDHWASYNLDHDVYRLDVKAEVISKIQEDGRLHVIANQNPDGIGPDMDELDTD